MGIGLKMITELTLVLFANRGYLTSNIIMLTIVCTAVRIWGTAMIEQVYNQYYDTAGNYHWIGVYSGEHIVRKGERMTREEALEILEAIYFLDEKKQKAFNMAIEALEEAKKREETWDW